MNSASNLVNWRRIARTALLGALATKPMTLTMEYADAAKVDSPWSSLPPRTITRELLSQAGFSRLLNQRQYRQATSVSHYGYGAAMGAIYGALVSSSLLRPSPVTGVGFGVAVWAASYLGWLPAINSRASANHQSRKNNTTMLLAHLVWGVSLGALDCLKMPTLSSSAEVADQNREQQAENSAT